MQRAAIGVVVVAALVAGVAVAAYFAPAEPRMAPEFSLMTTGLESVDGQPQPLTREHFLGRVVVIDLMARNCEPCTIVTRDVLQPQWAAWNETGVALLSVDPWAGSLGAETDDDLRYVQNREHSYWPHALDVDHAFSDYSVGLPRLLVMDAGGRLVAQFAGIPEQADVAAAVESAQTGSGAGVRLPPGGLVGLAAVAALAAVATPCAIGLMPGYLALVARRSAPDAHPALRAVRAGLAATGGMALFYAALTVLLWLAADFVRSYLWAGGVAVGLLFIAIGVAVLAGASWPMLNRWRHRLEARGAFTFGAAYGVASFACTGPILLPILAGAALQSSGTVVLVLAAYACTVAAVLIVLAALAGTPALARVVTNPRATTGVAVVTGILLVGSGAYLLWIAGRAYL